MYYGETQGELAIFDKILSAKDTHATEFIEEGEKEWFKNHLSVSLSSSEIDQPHPSPVFHEGEDPYKWATFSRTASPKCKKRG